MTTILALDTSTTACSVALLHGGVTVQRFVATPREHTRLVLPMMDDLLAEAGISLAEVDALAFTAGPGSFTGLRIGFGVIQGLAFGADLPVIPVSTLAVLALAGARKARLDNAYVLPALDARMGEIYWGLYRYAQGVITPLLSDKVSSPQRVMDTCPDAPDLGIGDGWRFLEGCLPAARIDTELTPDAVSVVSLAQDALERGEARSIDQVELAYIRTEVSWKKREKIRS